MSFDDVWDRAVLRAQTQRSVSVLSDCIVWNTGHQSAAQTLTKKQIMDLMTAKRDAATASKRDKKKRYYIDVDAEGECSIESTFTAGASGWCYINGSETALPAVETSTSVPKSKNKTTNQHQPTDQSAGAVTPKNVMKTTVKKQVKKNGKAVFAKTENKLPRGNNMSLTVSQWAKVDAKLAKEDISFSAFSRGLVLKAIGE